VRTSNPTIVLQSFRRSIRTQNFRTLHEASISSQKFLQPLSTGETVI
jgi:hypothetical protein